MPTRIFTKEEVKMACREGEGDQLKRVHRDNWEDEGKYSYRQNVLQAKDTGKFYSYSESRCGSHFTEYTYCWEWEKDELELTEVHEVEQVIKVWRAV